MDTPCLLTVHAHPDDEASKGAGTVRRYADLGVKTVLVCCTGGEEGDIHNPAMERPEVRENLPAVRRQELARATEIIGYEHTIMLGYRDSGMPDSEANADPQAFANAPLDEAVGRLVAAIREHRPQVVVTYGDDQRGYPHPDHLRVHDITLPAVDRAADPSAHPEAGEPWSVTKLYYTAWSRARIVAMHEKFLELGLESPYEERWFKGEDRDHLVTTKIDISDHGDVRWDALLAHATQIDPESPFWFGLPREVAAAVYPWDDYVRARAAVPVPDGIEHDLFAGIGDGVLPVVPVGLDADG